ncbi:glycoside hydrolase family 99-like domain-containing protein [Phenylobacterium sp.]|uniref:glycoside hydrolase family 99-like domain-containing protein n=1 Tax=Phenylobacterium sp. TaxID=1871053 RepID=UPI002F3ED5E0
MVRPTDPASFTEQRRAAHEERTQIEEARWVRFQAANRARYGGRVESRVSPAVARLLVRAKTPGRVMFLRNSGLWERDLNASLGSTPGPTSLLGDYVRAGPDGATQPRALFDQSWYLERGPALSRSRWPLLAHYLVVGDRNKLSPHPLLDAPAYRARHGARMSTGQMTALEHFLFEGAANGANPHPLFDVRHYVGRCEELAISGENPLIHYLRIGWREGLEPHPLFCGSWYLERNPSAAAAGIAPLLHYVTTGAAEGMDPHPLFDTAYYRKQRHGGVGDDALGDYLLRGARLAKSPTPHFNPRYYLEQAAGRPLAHADPLQHYLTVGTYEGLWPAPDFDEAGYSAAHLETAFSALSALEHWRRQGTERPPPGASDGRMISAGVLFADLRRASDPDPEAYDNAAYEALRHRSASPREPVRVVVIRRMTTPDWVAVARALPNFLGHLQPRLPADGFADPADPATLRRDVALAERYGVGGFCHEVASAEAATQVAASGFPFCLAWTGPAAPKAVVSALASPHAIHVDGRAVLLLPPEADTAAWRAAADLFLIQRGGGLAPGFDARLEDAPSRVAEGPPAPIINPNFRGLAHDHLALVAERLAQPCDADTFPLVIAARDTTPRSQDAPIVWQGASPGALQAWLEAASEKVRGRATDRRLVFLHAWNDWETGAALSPDLRFGHGWLEAVANAADADLLA